VTYLIDTNVASEAMRRDPNADVVAWTASQLGQAMHISAGTIAEIEFGIARLEVGVRRARFEAWRDEIVRQFGVRVLPVNLKVASAWGVVRARGSAARKPMSVMDALVAATAEVHGLTVVTRNVRDFEAWGGPVFNPWSDA
jgi:predicted nucleic acid-binding protein